MARFAIVDLNNLYFRAVNGSPRSDIFERTGLGLHITFRSILRVVRDFSIDHVVICTEGRSWRYRMFPGYKSKRRLEKASKTAREKEEDEILIANLQEMVEFMKEKTRMTVLQSSNAEGDDFIARFIALHPNDHHVILSSDSDFVQLIADNVTIFDAMLDRIITPTGIQNTGGDELTFEIKGSNGKIKVGDTVEEARKAYMRDQKALRKANPEHIIEPFSFDVEDRWWEKALFVKIVRGDTSDSIFSAYPKVRYNGTKKATGICEAWDDRHSRGLDWNNFMQHRWSKLLGADHDGEPISAEVTVKEQFEFNKKLIDLTLQPEDVVAEMDAAILSEIDKPKAQGVGQAFLQFCKRNHLPDLITYGNAHARYLNAAYPE